MKLKIKVTTTDETGKEVELARFSRLGTARIAAYHLCQTLYPTARVYEYVNKKWRRVWTLERESYVKARINRTLVTYQPAPRSSHCVG